VEQHEQVTIAQYQIEADDFREGTWNHDVSQNINALLARLPQNPGKILDLGCGPGRDLIAFKRLGHQVIGLDATPAFVEMAQQVSGCQVWQQSFLSLDLPREYFDGIFANASLIHVPRTDMVRVLKDLWQSLVVDGVIVMSMCRGNDEGYTVRPNGYRYVVGWEDETLSPYLEQAGFEICDRYYRPPGLPRFQQSWLVMVAKKRHNFSCEKKYFSSP